MGSAGNWFAERNCVQVTKTRPKNGLLGFLSAQISSLSLKLLGFSFVKAITGALHVTPLSSEYDTTINSGGNLFGFDVNGLCPVLYDASEA